MHAGIIYAADLTTALWNSFFGIEGIRQERERKLGVFPDLRSPGFVSSPFPQTTDEAIGRVKVGSDAQGKRGVSIDMGRVMAKTSGPLFSADAEEERLIKSFFFRRQPEDYCPPPYNRAR